MVFANVDERIGTTSPSTLSLPRNMRSISSTNLGTSRRDARQTGWYTVTLNERSLVTIQHQLSSRIYPQSHPGITNMSEFLGATYLCMSLDTMTPCYHGEDRLCNKGILVPQHNMVP
ncbi:hypothetical protein VTP01DRAFT_9241 [Rhizomucor pusillus]|uniref:uncharacterized protein n=1 Tax=Rhizomucor pusillus TaxID=4840 RepID=UPI003742A9A0